QCFRIADAVVAGAGAERVTESQRAKRRVTARAAAGNHQAFAIDFALLNQITRAICTIVYIHDSPLVLQSLAICTPKSGAATVVHIQHGYATAGPVLNSERHRRSC